VTARGFAATVVGWARTHPDLVALLVLVLVASWIRLAFLYRAPLFVRHDSVAYLQTGYEFARGNGFDLPLRRTPLYPLFVGGVVFALGEGLHALSFAQHALGVVSVALTYALARELVPRWAAFAAALLVSLSAPLLIYEHYILAEPLFIPLLLAGTWALVRGMRKGGWRWLVAAGVVLGLAALARPIGQALVPIAPIALAIHHRGFRRALLPSVFVVIGFAVVLVPWMLRGMVSQGAGSGGAVGQTLVGRIIRHDEGFVLPAPDSPAPYDDERRIAMRRLILTQMARDARPSAINHRVRTQFGLTEAQANAALQDVALEIIVGQWPRYVEGTLAKFRRLMIGEDERLRVHWATRKDGEMRDDWQAEASIAHLYSPPSPFEEREYGVAEGLTRVFQPYYWRWPLAALVVAGVVAGLVSGSRGPVAALVLITLALVAPSAALVGYVPRYRYPTDPLLLVLAATGAVALCSALTRAWASRGSAAERRR
jgi:hypothetical protein